MLSAWKMWKFVMALKRFERKQRCAAVWQAWKQSYYGKRRLKLEFSRLRARYRFHLVERMFADWKLCTLLRSRFRRQMIRWMFLVWKAQCQKRKAIERVVVDKRRTLVRAALWQWHRHATAQKLFAARVRPLQRVLQATATRHWLATFFNKWCKRCRLRGIGMIVLRKHRKLLLGHFWTVWLARHENHKFRVRRVVARPHQHYHQHHQFPLSSMVVSKSKHLPRPSWAPFAASR
jgi:hypothetical protein